MKLMTSKHKQTNTPLKRKVFVAMSGGVDSSVAALLLKRHGYDVTGAHMLCADFDLSEKANEIEHPRFAKRIGTGLCRQAQEDRHDAARVAAHLGIPFVIFDFRADYREKVFEYMIREYGAGRTPNPDIMCNSKIKFGIFLKKALELGADFIATGHYVQKEGLRLFEAKDKNKDQSYFLCRLSSEQISRAIFPIGDYLKSEVREVAGEAGLITASKKDSQGLCFVGKIDFQEYIREFLPKHEGAVVNSAGKILGKHDGVEFFTPGQRHGLKIGGQNEPIYVAQKEAVSNTLVVAEGKNDPILYKKEILVSDINWTSGRPPEFPLVCSVRIRYRQPLQKARIAIHDSRFKIEFKEPQRGVAPGQFAALYLGEELLGGGVICD